MAKEKAQEYVRKHDDKGSVCRYLWSMCSIRAARICEPDMWELVIGTRERPLGARVSMPPPGEQSVRPYTSPQLIDLYLLEETDAYAPVRLIDDGELVVGHPSASHLGLAAIRAETVNCTQDVNGELHYHYAVKVRALADEEWSAICIKQPKCMLYGILMMAAPEKKAAVDDRQIDMFEPAPVPTPDTDPSPDPDILCLPAPVLQLGYDGADDDDGNTIDVELVDEGVAVMPTLSVTGAGDIEVGRRFVAAGPDLACVVCGWLGSDEAGGVDNLDGRYYCWRHIGDAGKATSETDEPAAPVAESDQVDERGLLDHDCYHIDPYHRRETAMVAECEGCGGLDCPHGETLHYHHDGCPSCSQDTPSERILAYIKHGLAAATNQSLNVATSICRPLRHVAVATDLARFEVVAAVKDLTDAGQICASSCWCDFLKDPHTRFSLPVLAPAAAAPDCALELAEAEKYLRKRPLDGTPSIGFGWVWSAILKAFEPFGTGAKKEDVLFAMEASPTFYIERGHGEGVQVGLAERNIVGPAMDPVSPTPELEDSNVPGSYTRPALSVEDSAIEAAIIRSLWKGLGSYGVVSVIADLMAVQLPVGSARILEVARASEHITVLDQLPRRLELADMEGAHYQVARQAIATIRANGTSQTKKVLSFAISEAFGIGSDSKGAAWLDKMLCYLPYGDWFKVGRRGVELSPMAPDDSALRALAPLGLFELPAVV